VRSPLTVAAVQPACVPGDLSANAMAHGATVAAAGARLVVFPELSLTGYELDAPAVELDDDRLGPIIQACSRTGTTALVGAPVHAGDRRSIALLAVTGAGAAIAYRKGYLGEDETTAFTAGVEPGVLEIDGWRVGLGICKDTRIAQHIDELLALDIDLYVAALVHHWHEVDEQDDRAARIIRRCGVPVAFASAAGNAGSAFVRGAGHSCIWDRDGSVIACAGGEPGDIARAPVRP
jgi:predicted amidohydrolase